MTMLTNDTIDIIIRGKQHGLLAVLGSQLVRNGPKKVVAVRTFCPWTEQVTVIPSAVGAKPQGVNCLHADCMFEVWYSELQTRFPYQLEVTQRDGRTVLAEDPSRFPFMLSEDNPSLRFLGVQVLGYFAPTHRYGAP